MIIILSKDIMKIKSTSHLFGDAPYIRKIGEYIELKFQSKDDFNIDLNQEQEIQILKKPGEVICIKGLITSFSGGNKFGDYKLYTAGIYLTENYR